MEEKKPAQTKYASLTIEQCVKLMIERECSCGCGMRWKCLPTSTSLYARMQCSPDFDQTDETKRRVWGSLGRYREHYKRKKKLKKNHK